VIPKSYLLPLIVCLGLATGGFLVGYHVGRGGQDEPIPTAPLPADVVPVTVVKTIEKLVPGKPKVVERLKLVTTTVEVPVEIIKEVATFVDPIGRVRLEADKFEGLSNGKPAFGWKGLAICEIAPKAEPLHWSQLIESPFDLLQSSAETTIPPTPRVNKLRFDLGLGASSGGPLLLAGASRRLSHRTSIGRALMPDWVGVQAGYGSGTSQVAVTLSKEF
jgi:hypothetical protein